MSLLEIPYRFRQLVQKKFESLFHSGKPLEEIRIPRTLKILNIEEIEYKVFDNEFRFFGKKINYFEAPLDWHRDIFSGETYAKTFSKSINIRNNPNLSAKNVWELNRLQFLIQIAINYKTTKDDKYLNKFIEINESWIGSNPYLLGVNWYSNIEVNIRLINWFFCWEVLDVEKLMQESDVFKEFVNSKWIPTIYQHCKYSHSNPSKYSSANNHLVSEYSGLYITCSIWKFKEADKWSKYAKVGLEAEIVKQHSKGINKEEAAEYIQFITDFFFLPYVIGKRNNDNFSLNYETKLKEILDYILVFTDVNLNFPKYGDEDDGYVLNFTESSHFNNFKSLLVSASIIFNDPNYLPKDAVFDIKNQLLFSENGRVLFGHLKEEIKTQLGSKFYSDEGHFIFRKTNKNKEIYAHLDVAPLGYLSIAAHGHSDILSFLIHVNGNPFFIDSGTYSYHTEKKWRKYFVSSTAHNTITLDGENQAYQASDTMWLNHYKPKVISCVQEGNIERVVGTYNQKSNVQHIRSFEFNKKINEFLIEDNIIIKDNKEHKIFIPFHLHPTIHIINNTITNYTLSHASGATVSLHLDDQLKWNLVRGSAEPLLGWYSESFMKKEPTSVVFGEMIVKESLKIVTRIKVTEY